MKVNKKIALIGTTGSSFHGFRAELIRDLVQQGHQVYAFTSEYTDHCLAKIKRLGAEPIPYKLSRGGLNPFADIACYLQLKRTLKKIKPDIVFSYFAKPVIFGTFAAVLAGVKRRVGMLEGLGYVFTELPEGMGFKRKLLKWVQVSLYRMAFPFLEQLILLNKDDQIDLVDKYRLKVNKISVLGGIGLKLSDYPYSRPPVSPVSFIFVGRLLAEKGVHIFIESARIVKEQFPEARFVMLGGIDESNPGGLKAHDLERLKMEGVIEHPGHVSDVVGWVSGASVFVLPSYYREGVPRSTQEAMAIGRAILTTNVPGCRDTVVDGVNGYLVAPWSAEELSDKMIHFIRHPDDIVQMGLASHAMAQEKFDAGVVNQRLMTYLV